MVGWLSKLNPFGFRKKAIQQVAPDNYRWGDSIDSLVENAIYGSTSMTPSKALELYQKSSVVSTAVEIIALKMQGIRPVIQRNDKIDTEDEILDLLAKPNDHEGYRRWFGSACRNYLVTGNCYWAGNGLVGGPPKEIYNLSPIEAAPQTTVNDGYPDTYHVSGLLANGTYHREPVPNQPNGVRFVREFDELWQLYHIKGYTTRVNQLTGDIPLESIVTEIRQHLLGNSHNANLLSSGARLSMLFKLKQSMGEVQFREAEKKLIEKFGGASKAGQIGVVASDEVEVHEFGTTNKDMEYAELIEIVKSSAFSRFGIPLPLVTSSRQTFSNYKEAVIALYDDAVLPTIDYIFDGLSDFLLPRFGRDPRKERITYNPQSITALNERLLDGLKKMDELNAMTINEKRSRLPDLDDVEGGDVIYAPSTMVPVAGSGVDAAQMLLDDRDADDEARQLANDAQRQRLNEGTNENERPTED